MNQNAGSHFYGHRILRHQPSAAAGKRRTTAQATITQASPVYVNGQRVQRRRTPSCNNFVKLRDIGQAVDFGVEYDPLPTASTFDPIHLTRRK